MSNSSMYDKFIIEAEKIYEDGWVSSEVCHLSIIDDLREQLEGAQKEALVLRVRVKYLIKLLEAKGVSINIG